MVNGHRILLRTCNSSVSQQSFTVKNVYTNNKKLAEVGEVFLCCTSNVNITLANSYTYDMYRIDEEYLATGYIPVGFTGTSSNDF